MQRVSSSGHFSGYPRRKTYWRCMKASCGCPSAILTPLGRSACLRTTCALPARMEATVTSSFRCVRWGQPTDACTFTAVGCRRCLGRPCALVRRSRHCLNGVPPGGQRGEARPEQQGLDCVCSWQESPALLRGAGLPAARQHHPQPVRDQRQPAALGFVWGSPTSRFSAVSVALDALWPWEITRVACQQQGHTGWMPVAHQPFRGQPRGRDADGGTEGQQQGCEHGGSHDCFPPTGRWKPGPQNGKYHKPFFPINCKYVLRFELPAVVCLCFINFLIL